MTKRFDIALPAAIAADLALITDDQITTVNTFLAGVRAMLMQTVVQRFGGMLPGTLLDSQRVLLAGAGLFTSHTGDASTAAGLGLVAGAMVQNPLIILGETTLARVNGEVVLNSNAPDMEEAIASGGVIQLGSDTPPPNVVEMLRNIGINPGEEDQRRPVGFVPPGTTKH